VSERHRRPHGDGSLHRRADGKWVGVLDLGYIDGRRRRKYVYADTEREALAKLRGQRRSLERGQDILASVPTLSAWLTEWLTMKEAEGRRALTLRGYRMLGRKHIEPALGRIRLDRLKPSDVRHLLETKTAAGLAPASVRHIHGLIRNALADAERHELIARNVAKAVRPPSIRRVEQRALTIEEARRILYVVKGDRLEALRICGLTLGLRRGELLGLHWDDIDVAAETVRVRWTLQRANGRLQLVPPKTELSARTIPAPAMTLDALRAHHAAQEHEADQLGFDWPATGLVFVSTTGTMLEPRNVNKRWHELRVQAGLPWLRLHDLRHACASFMLAAGASPRTVMKTLGHSQISLTMNTYAHVLPQVERTALDAVAGMLS